MDGDSKTKTTTKMKYLSSSFSIPPPEKLDGIACEACVYGTMRGEKHTCAAGVIARFIELRDTVGDIRLHRL